VDRALCPIIVGRDEELVLIEDALLAANRGRGNLVLLSAEAGLGKTRLTIELERRARSAGAVVMRGSCSEADLALPYLPLVEAIGNFLSQTDLPALSQRLGAAGSELARLFPQLRMKDAAIDSDDAQQSKLRLFESIVLLLGLLAGEHGLLLVLEDVHWADTSTREFLDYVARRLRATRIMLLVTCRSDELHRRHPLAPVIQGWRRAQVARVIELRPLSPAGTAEMVRAIFEEQVVGRDFGAFVHALSEGNPFVLEETLKVAIDRADFAQMKTDWDRSALAAIGLPRTVRDLILLRVERLAPVDSEILKTASVLGPSFRYATLMAVCRRDEDTVLGALRTFIQQQLMEEEPRSAGRYRFRHALTREVIYQDLIAPERQRLHERAAAALRQLPGTAPIDLAHHLLAAGLWEEAIPVAIKAADDAERQHAYREAAELYERIIPRLRDKLFRGQVLCRMGNALFRAGDPGRAQRYLEEGIPLVEECGDREQAAHYRLALGRCAWERSRPDIARVEYERARASLEPFGPSEDLAFAYVRLAGLDDFEYESAKSLEMAQRGVETAKAAGADAARILAINYRGLALAGLGRVPAGLDDLDDSFQQAHEHGFDWIAGHAVSNGIAVRIENFQARQAPPWVERLRGLDWYGRQDLMAAFHEGLIYFFLGEPPKSERASRLGLALARQADASTFNRWFQWNLAAARAAIGDFDESVALLSGVQPELERQDAVYLAYVRMRVFEDASQIEQAVAEARAMANGLDWNRRLRFQELLGIEKATEVYLSAGQRDDARQLVGRAGSAQMDDGNPYLARMAGNLALADGDVQRATFLLSAATDFFDRVGYRDEARRTRRALASALGQAGEVGRARAELETVLSDAEELGALFEAHTARRMLADVGVEATVSPVSRAIPRPDLKKPTERLVTIMYADIRGYTSLTQVQAPASLTNKLETFYRWARQEVEQNGGLIEVYAGDAIMGTFNVAETDIDHCVSALETAMALRDKAAYVGLPCGIGIAVGAAVVGELVRGVKVTTIGETANLAARLQAQALAGEILLSDDAFKRVRERLVADHVNASEETLSLKGFASPVRAYRLAPGTPALRGSSAS
jgi:class 3 adenylate cyclase